jgi:hypothetical protein
MHTQRSKNTRDAMVNLLHNITAKVNKTLRLLNSEKPVDKKDLNFITQAVSTIDTLETQSQENREVPLKQF